MAEFATRTETFATSGRIAESVSVEGRFVAACPGAVTPKLVGVKDAFQTGARIVSAGVVLRYRKNRGVPRRFQYEES